MSRKPRHLTPSTTTIDAAGIASPACTALANDEGLDCSFTCDDGPTAVFVRTKSKAVAMKLCLARYPEARRFTFDACRFGDWHEGSLAGLDGSDTEWSLTDDGMVAEFKEGDYIPASQRGI